MSQEIKMISGPTLSQRDVSPALPRITCKKNTDVLSIKHIGRLFDQIRLHVAYFSSLTPHVSKMLWRGQQWLPTIEALDPAAHSHRLDFHLNVFHTFWDQKLTDAQQTQDALGFI